MKIYHYKLNILKMNEYKINKRNKVNLWCF